MSEIGFDVGTFTLICCTRGDKNSFVCTKEINAFIEIPLEDKTVYQMMKTCDDPVPMITRSKVAYGLGEKAVKMAYTIPQLELKRPMNQGCINPKEKDAYEILGIMIHSLLEGNVKEANNVLYYSVPANALNEETDIEYHSKTIKAMFDAYESAEKYKVKAFPINEGLALVYAELKSNNLTGIGISFGSGMCNVCYAIFGMPVFKFSLVNSGDWIDKQAAKATGESPTFINQEKMKINLTKAPENMYQRAIQTQYRLMLEKTITGIKNGLSEAGKKAHSDKPVDIIIAGGTSIPVGFDTLFKEILVQADLPIKIGNIVRPPDPLTSVARGCLICAENSAK